MITSQQAKASRNKLALSQNFIAKETGLSRPYISNFEAGNYKPNNEFLETLKAFFVKHGIKFDDDDNKQNEPNTRKTYQPKPKTIEPINGIIPDIDYMAYQEAVNIMQGIDELNGDLLALSQKPLPTKDIGIIFEKIGIDNEKSMELVNKTIRHMAKAYLDIMDITGNNQINAIYDKNIPSFAELTTSDEKSINDYVMYLLVDEENHLIDPDDE